MPSLFLLAQPPGDRNATHNSDIIARTLRGEDIVTAPDSPSKEATVIDIFVPIHNALRPSESLGVLHGRYDWDRGQAPPAREQHNHSALGLTPDILIPNTQGVVVAEGIPSSGVSFLGCDLRAAGWESAQAPLAKIGDQYGVEPKVDLLAGYYRLKSSFDAWLAVATQRIESALAPVFRLRRRLLLLLHSAASWPQPKSGWLGAGRAGCRP